MVNQTLSVEEVVGRKQKVPAESPKPGQVIRSVDNITYIDDFMETKDLKQHYLKKRPILLKDEIFH